ncbi:polysaccharide deacetylase [Bradyrhizobium diazoefficiens]|uniref:polysaccharide deacetylase family protein n=1 Tax=Bradyrhizobium diazoefficiens TaxID=1355477 RepID=UPI00190E49A6|nr:polysaccharide deacetylase [Bradyrhizobium diazoefficiens]MBK3662585.1 polysaccharide deacetylase [Bradyrhizobium diazoefficiens]
MSRHIACLTFDFDAMSGMIARGLTTPTPISRGEFGVIGVRRILALLAKYGLKASFFVPGVVIGTYPKAVEDILAAGHEIGNHGWTHVPPANMSREEEERGLVRANELINQFTGSNPAGYRSPSWDLSVHTVDLLLKNGFLYESSLMGDDHMPHQVRQGDKVELEEAMVFGAETPLIEMPISWSLDDFVHFEFLRTQTSLMQGLMASNAVLQNWTDDFEYMTRACDWGVLTYTCHPYVIGRGHRMMMLERLISALLERGAVFLTMREAAEEYRRLRETKSKI